MNVAGLYVKLKKSIACVMEWNFRKTIAALPPERFNETIEQSCTIDVDDLKEKECRLSYK